MLQGLAYRGKRRLAPVVGAAKEHLLPVRGTYVGDGMMLVRGPMGLRLLCPADDLSLTPELVLHGTYGPDLVRYLRRSLRPGGTVVDVGANLGLYTLIAAACVGPSGRVLAYECNPEMLAVLQRNVAMNWLDDRVEVIPKAASAVAGTATFSKPAEMKGLGSLVAPLAGRTTLADGEEIQVECERLDSHNEWGFVDLVKIDVEGGEAEVLVGLEGWVSARSVGTMAIEYRSDSLDDRHGEAMRALLERYESVGATFSVPGAPRSLSLTNVTAEPMYPNLLIRFPWAR